MLQDRDFLIIRTLVLLFHANHYLSNPRNVNANICPSTISRAAAEEYLKHRYPKYDTCEKPCTEMDIQTSLVSKAEIPNPRLSFMFGKMVPVSREVLSHSSFNLVAELGGYLGLTLGLSLMHLELPINMVWQQVANWRFKGLNRVRSIYYDN